MADPLSPMKEFRLLDEKLRTVGLSAAEEARWRDLKELVAPDPSPLRPGFDVNAAAAELKVSLEPAGLRHPEAPAPPDEFPAEDVLDLDAQTGVAVTEVEEESPGQVPAAAAPAGWDAAGLPAGAEDAGDPAWGAGAEYAQSWEPPPPEQTEQAQSWESPPPEQTEGAAGAASWEAGAPPPADAAAPGWDPGASGADAQAWDPNAPSLDGAAQGWDPSAQPADAGAEAWGFAAEGQGASEPAPESWDPNAAPPDAGAGWGPAPAPLDASGHEWPTAAEPAPAEQPWEPATADPGGQSWSPPAPEQPWEAAAQGWEPGAQGSDPGAQAWDPARQAWDPAAQGWDPGAQASDPAAPWEAPADLGATGPIELSPAEPTADPAPALEPAALDSSLSYDPSAPAPDAMAGYPSVDAQLLDLDIEAAEPLAPETAPPQGYDLAEPAPPFDALGAPEEYQVASSDHALDLPPAEGAGSGYDVGGLLETPFDAPGAGAGGESESSGFGLASAGSFAAVPPSEDVPFDDALASPEGHAADGAEGPLGVADAPPIEFGVASKPASEAASGSPVELPPLDTVDMSQISIEEFPVDEADSVLESAAEDGTEPPPVVAAPPPVVAAPPPVASAPPPIAAAPPVAAPAAAAPEAASPTFVSGAHRVVVHTVEGQVRRGTLEDVDLDAPEVVLGTQSGAPESLATSRIKAIFFMLGQGERPLAAQGKKVRVTFKDGRQVAGYSEDYGPEGVGFFMVPADTRTNTARIWVYRDAVRQVSTS